MPTRRTQIERRQESERVLLAAAVEAIAERGVFGASLSVIGERAGASRGLPTHHFGTKDVLVARVAARAQEKVRALMADALDRAQADGQVMSSLGIIRALVDTYIDLFERPTADERALLVMWGATFPSDSSVDGMLEAGRAAYAGWALLIEGGQLDGSIRRDANPVASSIILHGLTRGVGALLLTESQHTDMSRVRGAIGDWITGALAPRTGSAG